MDEVQVEMNEARVDSEDLVLLKDYIDLLLDPTLPTEQFDVSNYIPVLPKKDSSTGKSFTEALILASTNPQYDKRLFIDLPAQYMKTTSSEHVVYINCAFVLTFKTIYGHNMF
jgi:hypothetical protein